MKKKVFGILAVCMLAVLALCMFTACQEELDIICKDGYLTLDNLKDSVTRVKAMINGVEVFADVKNKTIDLADYLSKDDSASTQVEVSVEAYDDSGKTVQKGDKKFNVLPQVTVTIQDGYYVWTNSDAAIKAAYPDETVGYYVALNNVLSDNGAECQVKVPEGESSIMVRPYVKGNKDVLGLFSEQLRSKILVTPKNINFDGRYVSWGKVFFSDMPIAYKVALTYRGENAEPETKTYETDSNWLDLAKDKELYDNAEKMARLQVKVQAVSSDEENYSSSAFSAEQTIARLATVSEVYFENGEVTWSEVTGADSYLLKIDGAAIDFDATQPVTGTTLKIGVIPNSPITVKVKANILDKDAIVVANWSDDVTCTYLQAPTLRYESGTFLWNRISNCSGYRLSVEKVTENGDVVEEASSVVDLGSDINSYDIEFSEIGKYNVSIVALADRSDTFVNSVASNVVNVNKLSAPNNFTLRENAEMVDLEYQDQGAYSMSIQFDPVTGNNAYYQLLLNDTTISTGSTECNFTFMMPSNIEERDYELEVKTMSFDETTLINNTLTLSSSNTLRIRFTKLGIPSNMGFNDPNDDNMLVWDANAKARTFSVYANGKLQSSKTNKVSFANYTAGRYTARVGARGDLYEGGEVAYMAVLDENKDFVSEDRIIVSSDFGNFFYFYKLETPDNIRMFDNGAYLGWDGVSGASGYKIGVNVQKGRADSGDLDPNNVDAFMLCVEKNGVYQDVIPSTSADIRSLCYSDTHERYELSEYGATFTIIAIGNHGKELTEGQDITIDSEFSGVDIIFRLPKPTGLRATGSMLSWTAPANMSTNVRSYSVYDGNRYMGSVTTTEYQLESTVSAGKHYFKVVAEGDNVRYFSSEAAELENGQADERGRYIYKLEALKGDALMREGKEYKWKVNEKAASYVITLGLDTLSTYTMYNSDAREDGYCYFAPDFKNYKNPIVGFTVKGDNLTTIDSSVYQFEQAVESLPTPQGNNLVVVGIQDGRIKLDSALTSPINGGLLYRVDEMSFETEDNSSSVILDYDARGTHGVRVAFLGSCFRGETYWYTSALSETYVTFKYLTDVGEHNDTLKYRLITPPDAEAGKTYYQVTWNALDDVMEYRIQYSILDANGSEVSVSDVQQVNSSSAVIEASDEYVNKGYRFVFKIMTVGNGVNVFAKGEYTVIALGDVSK